MPHSLFLGSALATQDRVDHLPDPAKDTQLTTVDSTVSSVSDVTISDTPAAGKRGPYSLMEYIRACVKRHFRITPVTDLAEVATSHAEHENRPYSFVRKHLYHGIVDMVVSLLGLAVVINSM